MRRVAFPAPVTAEGGWRSKLICGDKGRNMDTRITVLKARAICPGACLGISHLHHRTGRDTN